VQVKLPLGVESEFLSLRLVRVERKSISMHSSDNSRMASLCNNKGSFLNTKIVTSDETSAALMENLERRGNAKSGIVQGSFVAHGNSSRIMSLNMGTNQTFNGADEYKDGDGGLDQDDGYWEALELCASHLSLCCAVAHRIDALCCSRFPGLCAHPFLRFCNSAISTEPIVWPLRHALDGAPAALLGSRPLDWLGPAEVAMAVAAASNQTVSIADDLSMESSQRTKAWKLSAALRGPRDRATFFLSHAPDDGSTSSKMRCVGAENLFRAK
jgi:hypothetical protein